MSYRTMKRLLGETNFELKSLVLFGLWLHGRGPDRFRNQVVTIAGAFTDELRLQVRSGDVRSEPLDIVTIDGEVYMEAERPLGCFTTDPTWELDFGVVRGTRRDTIELRNDCPDRVELSTRFRMGSTAFSLEGMPTGVDPGERVEVTVIATAPTGAIDEETLLIETSVPMVDRRPITLFVQRSSD